MLARYSERRTRLFCFTYFTLTQIIAYLVFEAVPEVKLKTKVIIVVTIH